MKYEYGVEYQTNGKKPDLPDDVEVCIEGQSYKSRDSVGEWDWPLIRSFRIVDERYKPKSEDSSWFERGELPPVGARFEAYFEQDHHPKWSAGVVAYKSIEHTILKFDDGEENHYKTSELKKIGKFRPIRTEREKAIEAAIAVDGSITMLQAAALYDAGLLRIPEEK